MALGMSGTRRRSWALPRLDARLVIGLVLVAVALAGGLTFANELRITKPVVVAARTIPAGQEITAADLAISEARLEGDLGGLAIGEAELASIVGQTAAQTIHAGGLIVRPDLGSPLVISPQEVAVTVPVTVDAIFGELRRGDQVVVMATSEPGRPQSQTTMLLERATVYDVAFDAGRVALGSDDSAEDGRITNVTLIVPRDEAEAVTHALVNGELTLLLAQQAGVQAP